MKGLEDSTHPQLTLDTHSVTIQKKAADRAPDEECMRPKTVENQENR